MRCKYLGSLFCLEYISETKLSISQSQTHKSNRNRWREKTLATKRVSKWIFGTWTVFNAATKKSGNWITLTMTRWIDAWRRHSSACDCSLNFIATFTNLFRIPLTTHMIDLGLCRSLSPILPHSPYVRKISDLNCYIIKLCSGCYPLNEQPTAQKKSDKKLGNRIKYAILATCLGWHK